MLYVKVKQTVQEIKDWFNEKKISGIGYAIAEDKASTYEPEPIYAIKFTADGAQTISFVVPSSMPEVNLQYSFNGYTYEDWIGEVVSSDFKFVEKSFGGDTPIYVRGKNDYGLKEGSFVFGNRNVKVDVEGNVMALLDYENPNLLQISPAAYKAFARLFNDVPCLRDASNLALPATGLSHSCYKEMFADCSNLIAAPTLPATTMENDCYYEMFKNCSKLVTAPALPATTLASACYSYMFQGCSKLVNAPALPATTLDEFCYERMFESCSSLKIAPELPATTLVYRCYSEMFTMCMTLNYVKCLATNPTSQTSAIDRWMQSAGVMGGTFVKDANTTWPTGESGIPDGWTVVDYAE